MIGALIGLVGLVLGFAAGAYVTVKNTKIRDRAWARLRCNEAAKRMQRYFASPVILLNMYKRAQDGHRYEHDKQFRRGLEETLYRAFGLSEKQ
jgi:hypothetical protein